MIRLRYSNRPAHLLECLGADICETRAGGSVWDTIHVVIANRHQEGVVKRHLAGRELDAPLAASANLRFWFLDELLTACLPRGVQLIDRATLQGVLLRRFQTMEGLDHEELAPISRYLAGPAPGRRKVQLAARLAELFENYLLSRPRWFAAWEAPARPSEQVEPLERCQRRLWNLIRADLGTTGVDWVKHHEVPARMDPAPPGLPGTLHVYGLGPMAVVYHQFLATLAERGVLVRIYALNPCREFWDDTPDPGARQRCLAALREPGRAVADPEDPYALLDPDSQDQPLLRRWGRPGREMLRLLNELGDWDFDPAFLEPGRATLLAALQQDVLEHLPPRPMAAADGSVRIHDCPTLAREAETLAEEIWSLMEEAKGTLRFSDLAIILPPADQEAYLAHLRAAFQGEPGIPMAEAERGSLALGELAEGLQALLDLAEGGFTRGRVLAAMGLPALQRRLGDADPEQWADWCRRLGIVRGWDQADLGTPYFPEDLLTWDQGLRRMALGAFMGEAALPFERGGQSYEPLAMATGAWEQAGRFIETLDRLKRDLGPLALEQLPLQAWGRRLATLAGHWLGGDGDGDRGALARVQAALAQTGFLEPEALRGTPYPFEVARELARQAIQRLLAHGLAARPEGVVVGSYGALRGMAFRVVLLPGLGEGKFPSKAAPDDLDLRAGPGRREAGDILAYERDRYFFMEALLGAEDRVILSYLGRHPVTGEPLAPSPVLGDLLDVLRAMLPDGAPLLRRHPLRRWEPDRFRPGGWGHLQRTTVGLEAQAALAGDALPSLAPGPAPAGAEVTVTLSQIRRFLASPLQGAAAAALGLSAEAEDTSALEAEPADTAFLAGYGLRRSVLWAFRREGGSLEACYRAARSRLAAEAGVGLGVIAEAEVSRDLAILEAWNEALPAGLPMVRTRFGAPMREQDTPADRLLPELRFTLPQPGAGPLEVRVTGLTEPWADLDGPGPLVPYEFDAKPDKRVKLALKAWVDHLALRAQAWADGAPAEPAAPALHLLLAAGGVQHLALPALTPEAGSAELARILAGLFGAGHGHLLPVEQLARPGLTYEQYLEWVEGYAGTSSFNEISCARGPIRHPESLPPAPEAAFLAARRRLEPLVDQFQGAP